MIVEQKYYDLESLPVDPQAADVALMFELMVAELSGVNPFQESVDRLSAIERTRSTLLADEAIELMGLVRMTVAEAGLHVNLDLVARSVSAELAVALRLSDRTIQERISEAWRLVEDFPMTLHALEAGTVSVAHARVVMAEGVTIKDPKRRIDYESAVLERAKTVTPGRLRQLARNAASTMADVSYAERHEAARVARCVTRTELDDGMSEIVATVPTILATGIFDRLTQMGNAVKVANPLDPRTLPQLRTDVLCELLLTGQISGDLHAGIDAIRAEVCIVIPALVLLGKSDDPATILGGGPIGMDDALRLAAEAPSLVRVITEPVTDLVLATDTYRPGERLRRYLRMRDGRCRCPSCNRSAWRCDIDHAIPYSRGGPTEAGNLAHLCKGHHTIKHLPGWRLRQLEPGVLEWTTPHGIVVVDKPDTPIQFT